MAQKTWNGGNGDWGTAADWSTGTVPTVADNAAIQIANSDVSVAAVPVDAASLDVGAATIEFHDAGMANAVGNDVDNKGTLNVDTNNGDGGTVFAIGGNLRVAGAINIGNGNLSANTTVNAAGLQTTGQITIQGNVAAGATEKVTLAVSGGAPSTALGSIRISGDATLGFGSGSFGTIAGSIEIDGSKASVSNGSLPGNSAFADLSNVTGTFLLRGASGYGTGGVAVTTGVGLVNAGKIQLDIYNTDGGSSLTLGGSLTNFDTVLIGGGNLTADTTLTATGLDNEGVLTVQGNTAVGATEKAGVTILGAAPTTARGMIRVGGDAALSFTGSSFTTIAGSLEIDGSEAAISSAGVAGNSALAGLSTIDGTLLLRGGSGNGAGGVSVSTGVGLVNKGTLDLDITNNEGGSSLTLGGVLSNTGTVQIGESNLTAATVLTATGLDNEGTIVVQGNVASAATQGASLTILGAAPATERGTIRVSGDAALAFGSGGFSSIAGVLEIDGAEAVVSSGGVAGSSALSGLSTVTGTLQLRAGSNYGAVAPTVTTTTGLTDRGTVNLDTNNTDGGSSVIVGGTLFITGTVGIGNGTLAANTTLTANSLDNAGTIVVQGNVAASATQQASLVITGASPDAERGTIRIAGDAALTFASGGFSTIAGNLELDGAEAAVAIGGAADNSGLTALSSVTGTLQLRGASSSGAGAPTISTTGTLTDRGVVNLDTNNTDGGSSLTVGGALVVTGTVGIGNTNLVASTVLSAASLNNMGSITVQGNANAGSPMHAALAIAGAAPSTLYGSLKIGGNAAVTFGSGAITAIAGYLELDGAAEQISTGGSAGNSALATLSTLEGTLYLRSGSFSNSAGFASLTTTTGLLNRGTLRLDDNYVDGGSHLTIGGTLSNFGTVNLGLGNLTADTILTAQGLANAGTITLTSNGSTAAADLVVNGTATSTGAISVNAGSVLDVTGAGGFSQTGGTTTVAGSLEASTIAISDGTASWSTALTNGDGTGALEIGGGGTIAFGAAVDASHTVTFLNRTGTLELDAPGAFDGKVNAFGAADVIHLSGVVVTGVSYGGDNTGGTLTVTGASGTVATLSFVGNYTASNFVFASDGRQNGAGQYGTDILFAPAAAAVTWTVAVDGSFTDGSNWSNGSAPGSTATAVIGAQGSYGVSLTSGLTVGALSITNAAASLSFSAEGQTATVTGDMLDAGSFFVDTDTDYGLNPQGGSTFAIGGALAVTGGLSIGSTLLKAASTLSAASLDNTGSVSITGNTSAGTTDRATLAIAAAAPDVLTGSTALLGDALIDYGAGSITTIASGASLNLTYANALVANASDTTRNSALIGLTLNQGTLGLHHSVTVTLAGDFTNTGTLNVDQDTYYGLDPQGGGTLDIAGTWHNLGTTSVGNSLLNSSTTVTAGDLDQLGTLSITGNATAGTTNRASVIIAAAAPSILRGANYLDGDALLEYVSGSIQTIATGATLNLKLAQAVVADANDLTHNSGLTGLTLNQGTFGLHFSQVVTLADDLTNTGTLNVDQDTDYGLSPESGSSLTIAGTLHDAATINIGNSIMPGSTTVTAADLDLTGTLNITGNSTAGTTNRSSVIIAAAAPSVFDGSAYLLGDALLEYASGSIQTIATGAVLNLKLAQAVVADASDTTHNSALTGLTLNAGTFGLHFSQLVDLAGDFTNTGTLNVDQDTNYGLNPESGSSLTIAGTLRNVGTTSIGSSIMPGSTTVTAADLDQTGTLSITGNATVRTANRSSVVLAAASPSILSGATYLYGDALLEYASGSIQTIASGATLNLKLAQAVVADANDPTHNSALTGLTLNAGTFGLHFSQVVNVAGDFTNTGTLDVDQDTYYGLDPEGGSTLTIAGALHNAGTINEGNGALIANTAVIVDSLDNTGTINLTGNIAATSTNAASLTVTGAAPDVLGGTINLTGRAGLSFGSGSIVTIAAGGALSLNGALVSLKDEGSSAADSGLSGLSTLAGFLAVRNGFSAELAGSLTSSGELRVDGYGGDGGSTLKIGGTFTNSGRAYIGNGALTSVATFNAAGLDNRTGASIEASGSAGDAFNVVVTGAVSNAGSLVFDNGVTAETGAFANTGTFSVAGNNQVLASLGVLGSVDDSGSFNVGQFSTVGVTGAFTEGDALTVAGVLDLAGGLDVTGVGSVVMQGGSLITPNNSTVTVATGGGLSGYGSIVMAVDNDGLITASGGDLAISGAITGSGNFDILAGAELELRSSDAEAVAFGGHVGTLKLGDPTHMTGAITGLVVGDTIDLAGQTVTDAVLNGSTLTVTAGMQTFSYQVAGDLAGHSFSLQDDQQGGTDVVLGVPGPAIFGPTSQTVFTKYPAVLGPLVVYDPAAGAGALTMTITTSTGLLAAVAVGGGTVSGNVTTSLTLTGTLTELNTELVGLAYLGLDAGADPVTVSLTDASGLSTTQHINVTTVAVPDTTPVLNGPTSDIQIIGSPTSLPGISVNDPYGETTGRPLALQVTTDPNSLVRANGSGALLVTGQDTAEVTIIGTPDVVNSYTADDIVGDALGALAGASPLLGTIGTAASELKDVYTLFTFAGTGDPKSGIDLFTKVLTELKPVKSPGVLFTPEFSFFEVGVSSVSFELNALAALIAEGRGVTQKEWNDFQKSLFKILAGKAAFLIIGDTHITTADGITYSLNAAGEFTLAKSKLSGNAFDVQVRLQPDNGSQTGSVITQVAAGVGADRVTFAIGRANPVLIDGVVPTTLAIDHTINLPGAQVSQLSPSTYQVVWNTGETLTVVLNARNIDVGVGLASGDTAGTTGGLFGSNNGAAGDFTLPDGTILAQPVTTDQLYNTFANAWRVTQAESLFDYAPGQTTQTFTDPSFPHGIVTLANLETSLPSALVAEAKAVVAAAGLTDAGAAAAAEFDYLSSGGNADLVTQDASLLGNVTTTSAEPTPSAPPPVLLGVYAPDSSVASASSGQTTVTFDVYLSAAVASDTTVSYTVGAPDADDFTAATFGGSFPTGTVTIAAGSKTASFSIAVPQGALGANPSRKVVVAVEATGVTSFAPTASATVFQAVPGPAAVPEIEYLGHLGAFVHTGSSYTLDLGSVQLGAIIPPLQFGIVNAAGVGADAIAATGGGTQTSSFIIPTVAGFEVSGASLPAALQAGASYKGLTVTLNQQKFGDNSATITFDPVDTNVGGYSAPLTPVTLTVTYTLELPGMIYSQAWGDVHIVTYNNLKYDFQATGDFTLAKSNLPGDSFDIQLRLVPFFPGASVTVIQQAALAVGTDHVTFDISRPDYVQIDGAAAPTLGIGESMSLNGGTLTEVSPSIFRVDWSTGETATITNAGGYINVLDGLPLSQPGGVSGLQGWDEGTQSDFQLPDGTVLPQPLTKAQLYGTFADAWRVSTANSLFDGPAPTASIPATTLSLADLPADVVARAEALVASAGITDPGIAAAAELDYIATGDPSFITSAKNVQQQASFTFTATQPTAPATALGVVAEQAKVAAATSGTTNVTFAVYLTAAQSSDTTVDWAVVSSGAGTLGATAFGGLLPTGSVTIAAGATSGTFTVDVPQGALGTDPHDDLAVQISPPSGLAVFGATAESEIVNAAAVRGNPAVPLLAKISGDGTLTYNGDSHTYTLQLGTLVQGQAVPIAELAIINAATAPADDLSGSFGVPVGDGYMITGDEFPQPIAPGGSDQGLYVTTRTSVTGPHTLTLVLMPQDVNDSGYAATLPAITLQVEDTVTAPAGAQLNTPGTVLFPNVHVGDLDSQAISLANAATAPAATLDVTASATSSATVTGSISRLASGATDAHSIVVGIDTSAAGARSGAVELDTSSDLGGGNIKPLDPPQNVDVFGSVYRLATASTQPNALTVHVGDSGAQTLSFTNIDASDGYSENLIATVLGTTGAVTATGTTGEIAAQQNGTLGLSFSTATAGTIGTVTLALASDGTGIDGLGITPLGQVTVPIVVTSGNVPAAAQFEEVSGGGTLIQHGAAYSLDLGTVNAPVTVTLGVLNSASAPANMLAGTFTNSGPAQFTLSGFDAFSGLAAGQANTAPHVTLSASQSGTFTEIITLLPTDEAGGNEVVLPTETFTITGKVATIAQPPVLTAPATATVQQGQATAIGGLSVSDPNAGATVTVTLSDQAGLLSAATTATGGGGTITGAGTKALTIAGTVAQVNADLTTLTDTDATLPSDAIAVAASDSAGQTATPASVAVTVLGPLAIAAPATATVQQGQATAIGGLSVSDPNAGATVTVTLSDQAGLLSVATTATGGGGTITGVGTKALTIVGTVAQVNADLTTLTDTDATLPSDAIAVAASDSAGQTATPASVAVTVLGPLAIAAPATATVQQGQATAIAGLSVSDPNAGATVTVTLSDQAGLLSVATTATGGGGTITGVGTKALTIVGTVAQVNADLTTLTDTDATLPSDAIAVAASDSAGQTATPASVAVTVLGPLAIAAPATATVQQGQATAIGGLSVSDPNAGATVTVTLSDQAGLLSVATTATGGGGTITGVGTKALTIVGTVAQVNADLTTLTDTDATLPSDAIAVAASDSAGQTATPASVTVNVSARPRAILDAPPTVRLGNVRIGDSDVAALTIGNAADDPNAAGLDVTATGTSPASVVGSIMGLSPGDRDPNDISVGLDTSVAGAVAGTVTLHPVSDGGQGATIVLPDALVGVTGKVYRLAAGYASPVTLVRHVGDPGTAALTLGNTDPTDGYSEALVGTLTGVTPGLTIGTTGPTGSIAAGASNAALSIGFSTVAAGTIDGTATIGLVSTGGIGANSLDGLGEAPLTALAVPVHLTINNDAEAALAETVAGVTRRQDGRHAFLDLGTVIQSATPLTIALAAINEASGPADLLSGSFSATGSTAFTNTLTTIAGLAASQSASAGSVTLATDNLGSFAETIDFTPVGSNASGYEGALATESLTITASVVAGAPMTRPATVTGVSASGFGVVAGGGLLGLGQTATLTVMTSAALTVAGGTPTLQLDDGGTATYTGGSGTAALSFASTIDAGENSPNLTIRSVALNGATVQDAGGIAADLSGAVVDPPGTLVVDTTPPLITMASPTPSTDQPTIRLTGSVDLADAGSTVQLFRIGSVASVSSATVASDGTFSASVVLNAGLNTFVARDTDQAGNVGASNSIDVTLAAATAASTVETEIDLLYRSILGRAAEPAGLAHYTMQMEQQGISLAEEAGTMINSIEGNAKYGMQSDQKFIIRLFENSYGEDPTTGVDAAQFQQYEKSLAGGDSRAEAAVGVALGLQHQAFVPATFPDGIVDPTLTGSFVTDPTQAGGQAYLLLRTLYPNEPSGLDLENASVALSHGSTLTHIAEGLLNTDPSFSGLSDPEFIDRLYSDSFDRVPDPDGLQHYSEQLSHGISRSVVAADIATSREHIADTRPTFSAGLYVPDATGSGLARLYQGIFGRAPDLLGLAHYADALKNGGSLVTDADGLLNSGEYKSYLGSPTDRQFIDSLYEHALGRMPEPAGFNTYQTEINTGVSRATVAVEITQSPEAISHLASQIENNFHV